MLTCKVCSLERGRLSVYIEDPGYPLAPPLPHVLLIGAFAHDRVALALDAPNLSKMDFIRSMITVSRYLYRHFQIRLTRLALIIEIAVLSLKRSSRVLL